MPVALTNCMNPELEEVARARYGVNFKSKFSLLNSWSIRLMICKTNWSWRRSSPILKMAGYSVPCSVTKVNLDGMREDLKRVAFSALMPQIEMLGSEGEGEEGSKSMASFDPLPLPLDPSISICGIKAEKATLFKSSLMPSRLTFVTEQGTEYPAIFKIGDDLRQDQLVLQIISLMDQLLRRENLDLKLTPYRALATSSNSGFMQFV